MEIKWNKEEKTNMLFRRDSMVALSERSIFLLVIWTLPFYLSPSCITNFYLITGQQCKYTHKHAL